MSDPFTVVRSRPDGHQRSIGMLSTFPPTACGIATFSAALAAGLVTQGATVDVVRCGQPLVAEDPMVVAALHSGDPSSPAAAVRALDATEVVVVQHEYGIYDGDDGDDLLEVLDRVVVPVIVVAHTVLAEPTLHQRQVLDRVCARADAVVVMTESARRRLVESFAIDADKVVVIVHGAATPLADEPPASVEPGHAPRLLTWGLLGPGKGIEWAIDAVAGLGDLRPRPAYLIAGATHPKVREHDGESYRSMLVERARAHATGSSPVVSFDDGYRDLPALTDLIAAADLVVLPYDSRDQVTSGVLVDAVAAGRPVVSTSFPHAVELLASGAGIVVPQGDPDALADAIRRALTEPGLLASMAAEARRLAPALSWGAVAREYDRLADRLQSSTVGSARSAETSAVPA